LTLISKAAPKLVPSQPLVRFKGALVIPLQGKVLAVGPDAKDEGISEGDTVVFGKYAGTEIVLDDKEYLILNSDEILGILK